MHVIDLVSGSYEVVQARGDAPAPRVGHTAAVVGEDIYVFGGRGGKDMTPLAELGALHVFSTTSLTWRRLAPSSPDTPYPAARSYHCSTSTGSSILIHAGCGDASTGRLNDLWSFELSAGQWTRCVDAPGDPRGGAAIAVVSNDQVWRFGGYNGKAEIGGVIDQFTLLGGEWTSHDSLHPASESVPGARSVTALLPLSPTRLITIMGEGNPSPTGGHDAAGNFWGDVWVYDIPEKQWTAVDTSAAGAAGPGERGWFAADVWGSREREGEGVKVVLWGGLNGQNEREPDGWILSLE